MTLLRKRVGDLTDPELLLFRALAAEWDSLSEDIKAEASTPRTDFLALSVATRDQRLIVQLLRDLNFPTLSSYTDGPDERLEEVLLREGIE